jgi:uncharacterized protein with PIN domain
MGATWIAQATELAQTRAQIADLEALIMLRGIHIEKQAETIADLRAELERTLAQLGAAVRVREPLRVVCPRCGGPLVVREADEFMPPGAVWCRKCYEYWWLGRKNGGPPPPDGCEV